MDMLWTAIAIVVIFTYPNRPSEVNDQHLLNKVVREEKLSKSSAAVATWVLTKSNDAAHGVLLSRKEEVQTSRLIRLCWSSLTVAIHSSINGIPIQPTQSTHILFEHIDGGLAEGEAMIQEHNSSSMQNEWLLRFQYK